MPIREFTAAQFRQPMERGVNSPFLVTGKEDSTNENAALVVKSRAGYGHKLSIMARELFALILAKKLGLAVVEPVIVELEQGFDYGANDFKDHRGVNYPQLIRDSLGANIATVHLGRDWKQWLQTSRPHSIPREAINGAFAFDALVQNTDRTGENPNLLWRGDELILLDFDKAFSYLASFPDEDRPWQSFLPMMQLTRHCLFPHLEETDDQGVADPLWEALEELQLAGGVNPLALGIPENLGTSLLDFSEICGYFQKVSTKAEHFFEMLKAHSFPTHP